MVTQTEFDIPQHKLLPLPMWAELGDLPRRLLNEYCARQHTVPIHLIIPTQNTVQEGLVRHYLATGSNRDEDDNLPMGMRFVGDERIYLTDGHHRLVAAKRRGDTTFTLEIDDVGITYTYAHKTYIQRGGAHTAPPIQKGQDITMTETTTDTAAMTPLDAAEAKLTALAEQLSAADAAAKAAKDAYDAAFSQWSSKHRNLIETKRATDDHKKAVRDDAEAVLDTYFTLKGTPSNNLQFNKWFTISSEATPVYDKQRLVLSMIRRVPHLIDQVIDVNDTALVQLINDNPAVAGLLPVTVKYEATRKTVWWSKLPEPATSLDISQIDTPKDKVRQWAQQMFEEGFVLLDFETTDFNGEPVAVAAIDHTGSILLQTLVQPKTYAISEGAHSVHGISNADVADAPTFEHNVYDKLKTILTGKHVIAYNKAFDHGVLQKTCDLYDKVMPKATDWHCAMLQYAQYNPTKANHFGSPGEKWKLSEACEQESIHFDNAHDPLGDVQATLKLMRVMAGQQADPVAVDVPAPDSPAPEAEHELAPVG